MNNIYNLFELVELQENINSLIESSLADLNNNELEVLIESSEDSSMLTLGATLATGGLAAIISRKNAARYIGGKLAKYRSKMKAPKIHTVKVNTGKTSPPSPRRVIPPNSRPVDKPYNTATVPTKKSSKITVPMNMNLKPEDLKPVNLKPSLQKFLDKY